MPDTTPAPIAVTVGSPAIFEGFPATITKIGPDESVDLVYYEAGRARVRSAVPHGYGPGRWQTPEEAEAGRPRSPLELVEIARFRGDRVPEVGARVVFAEQIGKAGIVHVRPTRAIIASVHSLTVVDLEILAPEPPDDPLAEDCVIRKFRNSTFAPTVEDKVVKRGYADAWDWPDGLIEEFGPIHIHELFPPYRCSRCRNGMTRHLKVYMQEPDFRVGSFETPHEKLCEPCTADLKTFMGCDLPKVTNAYTNGVTVSLGHGVTPAQYTAATA